MAQAGSALHWGCKGRRFKSCHPDYLSKSALWPIGQRAFALLCLGFRHLSVAIETVTVGIDRTELFAAREDCGHARPDWPFAADVFSFSRDKRAMSDFDSRDIRDRVEFACLPLKRDAQVVSSGFVLRETQVG